MPLPLQSQLDHLFSLRRDPADSGKGVPVRAEFSTLLERLGNPHLHLPPTIHVAGTNGKGSVIAFMRAMLEQAGYRVHVYTSPHLVKFNERIVLGGAMISDAELSALLDEVIEKSEGLSQSFFELTPALAFTAFARNGADILLLETGLGGRLDHTNIIPPPLASVIATLSYDHTHMLGDTIELIAGEKAGIMKPGSPCIVGHQIYPAVFPVLQTQAAKTGCPLITEAHWPRLHSPPAPGLVGAHQVQNAALAVATIMTQTQCPVPEDAMRRGIAAAHWPARLQKIALPDLPSGWEFWLDGGHNDSAGLVLAEQAACWARTDPKPLHIITGMMGHKDAAPFARALAPHADSVTIIPIPGHTNSCTPPEILARVWLGEGAKNLLISKEDWVETLQNTLENREPGRILLTGSLYLAQIVL